MRLLLVEDEPDLARLIRARLEAQGYVVDHAPTLTLAIETAMAVTYRAVVLDRRLPDGDGIGLLPVLRTRPSPAPALVLTALDDVPDRVAGLEAGADDYLVKPFAMDELVARLRVLLRRGPSPVSPEIQIGDLRYDPAARTARVGADVLAIPRRELAMLDALARRTGRVVLREHLEDDAYGWDDEVGPNALEACASRLRRRLGDANAGVAIVNIRGVGYMLKAG